MNITAASCFFLLLFKTSRSPHPPFPFTLSLLSQSVVRTVKTDWRLFAAYGIPRSGMRDQDSIGVEEFCFLFLIPVPSSVFLSWYISFPPFERALVHRIKSTTSRLWLHKRSTGKRLFGSPSISSRLVILLLLLVCPHLAETENGTVWYDKVKLQAMGG